MSQERSTYFETTQPGVRIRTRTDTVYEYAALSPEAQAKAREWYRELEAQDFDASGTLAECAETVAMLGVTLTTRTVRLMSGSTRQEPEIYYSGFSSQGDGASFTGTYAYAKGSARKVRREWPTDTELHRIADSLREIQRPWLYRLTTTITRNTSHYVHEHTVSFDTELDSGEYVEAGTRRARQLQDANDAIQSELQSLMRWIYKRLEAEYEYRLSDEAVTETIEANEYEFNADGTRAR